MILPEKNCVNCAGFAWWDGDYCCVTQFDILQPSTKGEFSDELIKSIFDHEGCPYYKAVVDPKLSPYIEPFNEFIRNK